MFRSRDYDERASIISNLFVNFLPTFFANCERLLADTDRHYVAGGEDFTYADLCLFQILHSFTDPNDPFYSTLPGVDARLDVLDYHPRLRSLKERVGDIAGVKKWMAERPEGLF